MTSRHIFFVLFASLLVACEPTASTTAAPAPADKPHLFSLPDAQMAHVKLVTVKKQAVRRPLVLPAVVQFDDLKTSEVMPLVSGKVSKVLVREGDQVRVGQPMLLIASPDSSDTAASLQRDQADLELKQAVLDRDRDLYQHKAISLQELQQAELDVKSAQATVSSDRQRVRITGTSTGHASLRAPIAGVVVSRKIAVGDTVEAGGTACFTVTDPSAVWVMGQLYQADLRRVAIGDVALLTSPVLDKPITGKVTYIGASIDPDTLTIPVRISAENAGGLLKQGEYINASIYPAKPENALMVPLSAVLRDEDNLPFVYVVATKQGETPVRFARRHITLGGQIGHDAIVQKGLTGGEGILADGAVFVQFADSLER